MKLELKDEKIYRVSVVCDVFFITTNVGPAAHDHPVQISTFFAVFVLGENFFLVVTQSIFSRTFYR